MFIAYYDESGDDGYPKYSSPLFVLSALYIYYLNWREAYDNIHQFRQQLKRDFGVHVKLEFHAKHFLLNKKPYRHLGISDINRTLILDLFCDLVGRLECKIINVVINKLKIKGDEYNVLENAFKYSIQRIENDLEGIDPAKKFMIITDNGRIGKMRKTSRKIQKINYIPSRYNYEPYRKEIRSLIEDPLPKDSKESYFIQISDLVAYIVYLHKLKDLNVGNFPNRLPETVTQKKVYEWLGKLETSLNLKASTVDPYGIVTYPK